MIATLAEAWAWYEAVHDLADWVDRIAQRYWDDPRLAELLGLDNKFRTLAKGEIQDKASQVLEDLEVLLAEQPVHRPGGGAVADEDGPRGAQGGVAIAAGQEPTLGL
jgi:hypothetical protein